MATQHPRGFLKAKRITIIVEAEDGNGLVWECPNVSRVNFDENQIGSPVTSEVERGRSVRVKRSAMDHLEISLSFDALPDEKAGEIIRYGRTSTAPLGDG